MTKEETKIKDFVKLMIEMPKTKIDDEEDESEKCQKCGSSICAMVQRLNDLKCHKTYK